MKDQDLTLDPSNWDEFRKLARRMLDDMIDHLSTLRNQPVWRPMPDEVRARLEEPVPMEGQGEESTYNCFIKNVLPFPNGNLHPRFFGWVQGNGTPLGMMADMLAAGMNAHLAGFNQAPAIVEDQLIRWLIKLMDFPSSASGVLAGGGTMANILSLAVARNTKAGFDIRGSGLIGSRHRMMVYASRETHGWLVKGVELLGLGRDAIRYVPVDNKFEIDVDALVRMINDDRNAGHQPFCVVGNAGTVNTGATDNLQALARICREEDLWLHVDGAFGALAYWSERLRPIVAGINEADSLTFDLHKWMYQPFTIACVLVRNRLHHQNAFMTSATYLASSNRGVAAGGMRFFDLGIDLTREFRALKAWMGMKAHGVRLIVELMEQNVDQAQLLAAMVHNNSELELLAPVALNIVCLRYAPNPRREDKFLNRVNEEVLLRLQESGIAVPSSTILNGRFAIRCCFVNHRTRKNDITTLIEGLVRFGRDVYKELLCVRA